MRTGERRVDRVAQPDVALAATDDEVEWRRNHRCDNKGDQPERHPTAGPLLPVEIAGETGDKADREGNNAVRGRSRVNRVRADQVADEAGAATEPRASDDAGQHC